MLLPRLAPWNLIVAGQRSVDADIFMGIGSACVDVRKIPFYRRNIIMIKVVVAGGDDVGLQLRHPVAQPFAKGSISTRVPACDVMRKQDCPNHLSSIAHLQNLLP